MCSLFCEQACFFNVFVMMERIIDVVTPNEKIKKATQ